MKKRFSNTGYQALSKAEEHDLFLKNKDKKVYKTIKNCRKTKH